MPSSAWIVRNYAWSTTTLSILVVITAMGASFTPCYAKFNMGWWYKSCIWRSNPFASQIVFYRRFIDDVIVIWDGPPFSFSPFVQYCKKNNMGISFTHVHDTQTLVFLNLK